MIKNIVKVGYRVYYTEDVLNKDLKSLQKVVCDNEGSVVTNVFGYDFVADNTFIDVYDLLVDTFLVNTENKIISPMQIKDILIDTFPNIMTMNESIIKEYIDVGTKYIFNINTIEDINSINIEELRNLKKNEITFIDVHGICSESGFLDMYDTLYKCVYFDKNDDIIDISKLQGIYDDWWKQKKNL